MFNKNIEIIQSKPFTVFKCVNFLKMDHYEEIRANLPKFEDVLKLYSDKTKSDSVSLSSRSKYYDSIASHHSLKKLHDMVMGDDFLNFFYKHFFLQFIKSRLLNPIQLIRLLRPYKKKEAHNKGIQRYFVNSVDVTIQYSFIPNGGFLNPHTDSQGKLLSLMIYFPDGNKKDEINYGTQFWNSSLKSFTSNHQIGDLANKFRKNYTKTIKSLFEQNVLYGFVRNNKSWHSVEPTKISDEYIRKSININFNF